MKFFADENFNFDMLRELLTEYPDLDIKRVQDTDLSGADDVTLLHEAARQGAIILTHDVTTMTKYAYERVRAGLPMPGVIEVVKSTPIRQAIDDLILLIGAGTPEDFENQDRYVPLH